MYENDTNKYGCPLHNQTGDHGVRDFALIIRMLPAELRDAFEREREACREELEMSRVNQQRTSSFAT